MTSPRSQIAAAYAGSTVAWAEQELELTTAEIAAAVGGVARKTVQRWRQASSAPRPEHRRYLERLNQLRFLLETSFRTTEDRRRWMHMPVPAFGGRTPLFTITEGEMDLVLETLAGLAHGAHI